MFVPHTITVVEAAIYAKVFSSLWDGSMRGQSDKQLVFIYLLCHANSVGMVDIIQGKVADDTGLTEDVVSKAIRELMEPDERSRTEENEGRVLVPLSNGRDWGWQIVNYDRYRAMRNEDDRRLQNRQAQARYRDKHRSASNKPQKAQGEAEAEAEGEEVKPKDLSLQVWKDEFEASFWPTVHPDRRQAKAEALAEWMKLKPRSQETLDLVCDAMEADVAGWAKERTEPKYIPHARKWLKDRRYIDHAENR